jgi:hypothetical protein
MPIRHGCMLASRNLDLDGHLPFLLQYDTAPIWPITWNECLPISVPITAIALLSFCDMACSLSFAPLPASLTAVLEHSRTIPMIGLH